VGIFGVDYILQDDEPWLVEVNPRYTASVEVIELALGRSLLAEHRSACEAGGHLLDLGTMSHTARTVPRIVGKAILYAESNLVAPEIETAYYRQADPFAVPALADIPWPGMPIATGEPVMTVFATGEDAQTCEQRLEERLEFWNTDITE
jgi:predicted ATP-grasp superfamily ATP-dependent carboligase